MYDHLATVRRVEWLGAAEEEPYGYCPVCGLPGVIRCRCKLADTKCSAEHHWHFFGGEIHLGRWDHAIESTVEAHQKCQRWGEWLGAIEPYATKTPDDLVPEVRGHVDALIAEATRRGFKPKVRSVGRTCEQQAEQVKLGYSQAGLCRSMHTLGHAVDLDLSPNACSAYTALGEWWETHGGVWGGRWKQFGACGDAGHYHWGFNKSQAVPTSICPADVSLEECRKIRENYLKSAFASSGKSERGYNLLAVGTFVVIGGLVAVAYARGRGT